MGRAGAAIMSPLASTLSVFSPKASQMPNSFKTALEDIEDQILQLQSEVSY